MAETYVRITFHKERIDDNTGRVIRSIGRVITGQVQSRRGNQVTILKDSGGTMVFEEQNPVMAATMLIEYFDTPPVIDPDATAEQAEGY
jgi:hypothetical protein